MKALQSPVTISYQDPLLFLKALQLPGPAMAELSMLRLTSVPRLPQLLPGPPPPPPTELGAALLGALLEILLVRDGTRLPEEEVEVARDDATTDVESSKSTDVDVTSPDPRRTSVRKGMNVCELSSSQLTSKTTTINAFKLILHFRVITIIELYLSFINK